MSGSRWMLTLGSSGSSSRSKIKASDSLASTNTPRKASLLSFRRDAGDRQHRVHQHVGARGAVGLRRVFQFVVADAVLARHEYHRRGNARVEVAGVGTGTGRKPP